jgi:glycosyltransferase involved in cell wall biosynthesis
MKQDMPEISVVIASKVGSPFLDQCLESIKDEVLALGAEVVVASGPSVSPARVARDFPWVRVVHAPELTKVPALRRRGVEKARGDAVAIIEEHCSAAGDWLHRALASIADGKHGAAGGAISHFDYDRLRDWVVYFCEYNSALPPAAPGETHRLNEANIVYNRRLLLDHLHLLDEGYWEMTLHPVLLQKGIKLLSVPEMVVYHRGPFDFGYYLHQRFLFSRAFAGVRASHQTLAHRLAYLLGAPLIPFMLFGRMASKVVRKRCRVTTFVLTLPLIVPTLIVLVAGEWVGYLMGPGDALSRVE